MPSRFAQWKLYFHKNKSAEKKAGGSGMEVEGKEDLVTGHRFCSFPLHCLLLSLLQEEDYPILSHGAMCCSVCLIQCLHLKLCSCAYPF